MLAITLKTFVFIGVNLFYCEALHTRRIPGSSSIKPFSQVLLSGEPKLWHRPSLMLCVAHTFSHSVACIFIIFRSWWKILNFNLDQFLNLRCFFLCVCVLVMKSFTTTISWRRFSIFSSKSLIFQTLTCRVMAHLELILYLVSGEGSFLVFLQSVSSWLW